ncbi:cell adhesion molecule Dscam2-like [Tigriopus californicus]|uniref:cell adhesion molecule Dscam2-like n=1 Tax=Tigriopus californicus TaxID=6832 RepID=UPI0027DA9CD6|nr:cell adhesion molecule Dscam2-like [Tigriopus californicus]
MSSFTRDDILLGGGHKGIATITTNQRFSWHRRRSRSAKGSGILVLLPLQWLLSVSSLALKLLFVLVFVSLECDSLRRIPRNSNLPTTSGTTSRSVRPPGVIANKLGPTFHLEPPAEYLFSNDTGGILDCSAHGIPSPRIIWQTADGQHLVETTLREVLPQNHSLWFRPFPMPEFKPEIHHKSYRCLAVSESGTTVSRTVKVKAVLRPDLNVQVKAETISPGNSALLRCEMNRDAKEYTQVWEWHKDGSKVAGRDWSGIPRTMASSRYLMLPKDGHLVVLRADLRDTLNSYRCVIKNMLSNDEILSAAFNIEVESSTTQSRPKLLLGSATTKDLRYVEVGHGQDALIPCFTTGSPPPLTSWFQEAHHHLLQPLPSNPRFQEIGGALIVKNVKSTDFGSYRCVSRNPNGETSTSFHLIPLKPKVFGMELVPDLQVANLGSQAKFRCRIFAKTPKKSGANLEPGEINDYYARNATQGEQQQQQQQQQQQASQQILSGPITWLKDGRPIHSLPRVRSLGTVNNQKRNEASIVISNVQIEDAGIYQCFSRDANGKELQSSAELRMGDAGPRFLYTFIDQTLQPGPTVSLKCSAAGNPTPNIKWTLDGFPLPDSERFMIGQYVDSRGDVISHLNITQTRIEDGGRYFCEAYNRAGSVSHSARLNVYGAPFIRRFPTPLRAIEGKPFLMICPAAGFPIEEITWTKDGRTLIRSPDLRVFPNNGTLIVNSVSRSRDEGFYTCRARNRQGQGAEGSTNLKVIVPPEIVPFPTSSQVVQREGFRTRLLCGLARGDLPITFRWLKDGSASVKPSALVQITSVDDFSSLLTFVSLQSHHSGNYTCVAENSAGRAEFTAQLTVKVPPSWILKPQSLDTVVGARVELPCQANGSPAASIVWKKELASRPGEFLELFPALSSGPFASSTSSSSLLSSTSSSSMIEVVEHTNWFWAPNGSLILARAQPERSGRYLCQVSNGIGQDLNQMVTFTVKAPPQIILGSKQGVVSTFAGSRTAQLECEAKGDKPISVTWNKNGQNLMSKNTERRYSMETLTTALGVKSVLTLRQVIKEDEDKYSCHMKNPYGEDIGEMFLLVQEPPSPPVGLQVGQVKSDSVHLVWSIASKVVASHLGVANVQNLPITKFIIDISPVNVPWDSIGSGPTSIEGVVRRLTEDGGHRTSASILNLRPYVEYKARIMAENALGVGKPSPDIKFRTLGSAPEGQVRDVRVKSTHPMMFFLQWEDPETHTWNGPLTAYKIGWKKAQQTDKTYNWTEIERHDTSDLKVTLKDLTAFTQYEIIIQAINDFGIGPKKTVVSRTQSDVPLEAPSHIKCRSASSTSIEISWKPLEPDEVRGDLVQYNIHYQDTETGTPEKVSTPFAGIFTVDEKTASRLEKGVHLEGLTPNRNYSLLLSGQTSRGEGPISQPTTFCLTLVDVPKPPEALKILRKSSTSVVLSWLPPSGLNRERLSHYTIYQKFRKNGKVELLPTTVPTTTTHYEIRGLDRTVFHTFWITATNEIGEGDPSEIQGTRLVELDGRSIVLLSLNQTLTVIKSHTAILPCEFLRNEREQNQYHRLWMKDQSVLSGSSNRIWSVRDELRIRDTRQRDSGNYSCTVNNPNGGDSVFYEVVIQDVPDSPEIHITSLDPNSISLELRIAQELHSLPLISCTVFYKQMYGSLSQKIIPGRQIHNIHLRDLQCGRTYQIYARCTNRLGHGSMSKQVSRRTLGQKPEVPNQDFLHPSNESVRLDLYRWNSEECPVSYFVVEYKLVEDQDWTLVSNNLQLITRRFSIRQLQPEQNYQIRVRANNAAGSSENLYSFQTISPKDKGERLGSGSSLDDSRIKLEDQVVLIVPVVIGALLVIVLIILVVVFIKKRSFSRKGVFLQSEEHLAASSNYQDSFNSMAKLPDPNLPPPEAIYAAPGPSMYQQISGDTTTPSTLSKIPENPEDIFPYATFVLPEGVHPSQVVPHTGTLGRVNLVHGTVGRMDSLVLHQNPTLPLSDANSKSSASNNYSSVHRPKRRKKRLSRQPSKAVEESDSDCLPPTKRNEIGSKLDFSHWDPSPKKPFRPQHQVQIIQNYAKRHGRSQYDPDSTSFSSESGESSPDCGRSPLATPISEEERIFIKQNNGQFMALKPSQVMMHTHRSHLQENPQFSPIRGQNDALYELSETESSEFQHQGVTSFQN